jgi:4-amino-4-deoxy-L-arabinose transferase-like glycosyltransferase
VAKNKFRPQTSAPAVLQGPDNLQLSIIFRAAFALRALHLLAMQRQYPLFNFFFGDAASYDEWAKAFAAHGIGATGVFYQDPLYPCFLGTIYRLFGYAPVLVRWIQVTLGGLNCVLIAGTSRRLFGKRAAWIAGAISAGYGIFIFFEGTLLKEGVSVFLSSLALWSAIVAVERSSWRWWAISGLALGDLVLTRGNALVLVPIILFWLLFLSRQGPRRLALLAGSFMAGFFLALSPATLHNYRASHDWVLTTSQAGSNFFIGNHAGANGTYIPLVGDRQTPEYEAQDARRLAEYATHRALKPSEVSHYWFQQAFRFITQNPSDWFDLLGAKTKLFIEGYELPDVEDYYLARRFSFILRLPLVTYYVLLPLAFLGMLGAVRQWRQLFLLYGFAVGNAVSVILFYIFSRYRLPSVPPLMVFAAGAGSWMWGWVESRRWMRVAAAGLALGALSWTLAPKSFPEMATSLANLGTAYRVLGQPDKAAATLQEAIQLAPLMPEPHFTLANLYMAKADYDRAMPEYQRAVDLDPGQTEARYLLGVAYFKRNDYASARREWEEVLRLQPSHPDALYALRILNNAHR